MTQSRWWQPELHLGRRPLLLTRAAIAAAVRSYFAAEDFIEVDTSAIQLSPGNEAHIHAFPLVMNRPDGSRQERYLHTSPEFAMKKLLAAGEQRIFSMAHVFRDSEHGPLHAPEFTMLEWYRAGEAYDRIIEDCLNILRIAADCARTPLMRYRSRSADPGAKAFALTLSEAFAKALGIDLLATCRSDGSTDREALACAASHAGFTVRNGDSWSDIFSLLLVAGIEPMLASEGVCLLHQYPRAEAALARSNATDPRVADRFELYVCGVELANGFRELTDAAEQRRRFEAEMHEKQRVYGHRYPLDEDFLQALAFLPEASGVALGFDRLVMLATAAPTVQQVMWTPDWAD